MIWAGGTPNFNERTGEYDVFGEPRGSTNPLGYFMGGYNPTGTPGIIEEYSPLDDSLRNDYINDPSRKGATNFGEAKGASMTMFGNIPGTNSTFFQSTPDYIPDWLDAAVGVPQTLLAGLGTIGYQLQDSEGPMKGLGDWYEQMQGYTGARFRREDIQSAEDAWESGRKTEEYFNGPPNATNPATYYDQLRNEGYTDIYTPGNEPTATGKWDDNWENKIITGKDYTLGNEDMVQRQTNWGSPVDYNPANSFGMMTNPAQPQQDWWWNQSNVQDSLNSNYANALQSQLGSPQQFIQNYIGGGDNDSSDSAGEFNPTFDNYGDYYGGYGRTGLGLLGGILGLPLKQLGDYSLGYSPGSREFNDNYSGPGSAAIDKWGIEPASPQGNQILAQEFLDELPDSLKTEGMLGGIQNFLGLGHNPVDPDMFLFDSNQQREAWESMDSEGLQGSSFGTISEAEAVESSGFGSDAHFDAIEASFGSSDSSSDSGGWDDGGYGDDSDDGGSGWSGSDFGW